MTEEESNMRVPHECSVGCQALSTGHFPKNAYDNCLRCEVLFLRNEVIRIKNRVVELAVENKSVAEYMKHWERRAEVAEIALKDRTNIDKEIMHQKLRQLDRAVEMLKESNDLKNQLSDWLNDVASILNCDLDQVGNCARKLRAIADNLSQQFAHDPVYPQDNLKGCTDLK